MTGQKHPAPPAEGAHTCEQKDTIMELHRNSAEATGALKVIQAQQAAIQAQQQADAKRNEQLVQTLERQGEAMRAMAETFQGMNNLLVRYRDAIPKAEEHVNNHHEYCSEKHKCIHGKISALQRLVYIGTGMVFAFMVVAAVVAFLNDWHVAKTNLAPTPPPAHTAGAVQQP